MLTPKFEESAKVLFQLEDKGFAAAFYEKLLQTDGWSLELSRIVTRCGKWNACAATQALFLAFPKKISTWLRYFKRTLRIKKKWTKNIDKFPNGSSSAGIVLGVLRVFPQLGYEDVQAAIRDFEQYFSELMISQGEVPYWMFREIYSESYDPAKREEEVKVFRGKISNAVVGLCGTNEYRRLRSAVGRIIVRVSQMIQGQKSADLPLSAVRALSDFGKFLMAEFAYAYFKDMGPQEKIRAIALYGMEIGELHKGTAHAEL